MPTGTVKWFNDEKGFGFIASDNGGRDLFVHHTSINSDGYRSLAEGSRVSYEEEEGPKTRQAVRSFEEWTGLKSLEKELEQGTVTRESPITDAFRKKLDEIYERPAGMHHGATFTGDDRETDADP